MGNTGIADDWLRRAKSSLLHSQHTLTDGIFREDLCFDAQQAVEKSLKALLISKKISFRYTHNIEELLTSLERKNILLPDIVCKSARLTVYAVETRYPGNSEPVTKEEYEEAIRLAKAVYEWAKLQLQENKVQDESKSSI